MECGILHISDSPGAIAMAGRVAFLATMSPADEPRIQTMFGYAMVASSMGYDVLVFFTLDGALIVRRSVFNKLSERTRSRIEEAIKAGIKVKVCSSAVETFGIKKEEIIEGVEVWGIASFYDYASEADIVLTW